ncbi:MAG: PLP-dependent transferase, partial [Myxococcota bacterium]
MAAPKGFATRTIHSAAAVVPTASRPVVDPIFQTASFSFDTTDDLARGVSERGWAYSYSRLENPTTDALAQVIAELEGAEAGVALASGMAAVHAALLSRLRAGDHVVAARALYGNTAALLRGVLARCGVETTFADATDLAALR